MKKLVVAAAVVCSITALPAVASQALAQKNACMSCHAVDKKLVGPSFKDIAAKYKGEKDAVANLSEKVKKGGKGAWGEVPMPPNPQVKDDDIKAIVTWVLTR